MNQQEIQLQLLQQQHFKKLSDLNKQRLLLNSENSFNSNDAHHLPSRNLLPLYKPEPSLERLLHGGQRRIPLAEKARYIPNQIDSKIADKSMEAILQTWSYSSKYSQDDIYLSKVQKQRRQLPFQSELSLYGKLEIDQILEEGRLLSKTRGGKSLKQRYQKESIEQKLSDLYSHISKLKRLDQ